MSLKKTKKKGFQTLISIAVIGIAVYLGFTPLFSLTPEGVPQAVITSSFGAIFVIILTMYLLNKQTEVEQESKRGQKIFEEKVGLYNEILNTIKSMLSDGKISEEEINKLPFPVIKLSMLADNQSISSFVEVYSKLNKIYQNSEDDSVDITDEEKDSIYRLLIAFASYCRKDIGISEEDIDTSILSNTVNTIIESTKKKRDYTKFNFNGKDLSKNRYVYEVISTYVKDKSPLSINEFNKIFPRDLKGKSNSDELWKTYDEAIKHYEDTGYTRYFISIDQGKDKKAGKPIQGKELVINLDDAEVCISNQWDLKGVKNFIEKIKEEKIRFE